MKIAIYNETQTHFDLKIIKAIEKTFDKADVQVTPQTDPGHASINLIVTTKQGIITLNKQIFKKNNPTDVISINSPEQSNNPLGDIYICLEVIKSNAANFKVSYAEEITRVIIHGILHLLGYDHKKPFGESEEEMFKVQEKLTKQAINTTPSAR